MMSVKKLVQFATAGAVVVAGADDALPELNADASTQEVEARDKQMLDAHRAGKKFIVPQRGDVWNGKLMNHDLETAKLAFSRGERYSFKVRASKKFDQLFFQKAHYQSSLPALYAQKRFAGLGGTQSPLLKSYGQSGDKPVVCEASDLKTAACDANAIQKVLTKHPHHIKQIEGLWLSNAKLKAIAALFPDDTSSDPPTKQLVNLELGKVLNGEGNAFGAWGTMVLSFDFSKYSSQDVLGAEFLDVEAILQDSENGLDEKQKAYTRWLLSTSGPHEVEKDHSVKVPRIHAMDVSTEMQDFFGFKVFDFRLPSEKKHFGEGSDATASLLERLNISPSPEAVAKAEKMMFNSGHLFQRLADQSTKTSRKEMLNLLAGKDPEGATHKDRFDTPTEDEEEALAEVRMESAPVVPAEGGYIAAKTDQVITSFNYSTRLVRDYNYSKNKGAFIEFHNFPHFMAAATSRDRLRATVGRRVNEQFYFTDVYLPFGYGVMLDANVIHTDSATSGKLHVLLEWENGEEDSVIVRSARNSVAAFFEGLESDSANGLLDERTSDKIFDALMDEPETMRNLKNSKEYIWIIVVALLAVTIIGLAIGTAVRDCKRKDARDTALFFTAVYDDEGDCMLPEEQVDDREINV